jgi:hypothetical protein
MISQSYWLGLPKETRQKLANLFNIPRSTFTHVEGNVVVSDGYTLRDLALISKESLQEYTGETHDDFYKLLEATIEKLTAPLINTSDAVRTLDILVEENNEIKEDKPVKNKTKK